jgi:predicted patatin/cPLA2 family phospholipase
MRASASMPLVSNIVTVDGIEMLDGGMSDSIPIRFMQDRGYEKNLVVLTQPRSYVKQKNKALPIIRIKYRKYPKSLQQLKPRLLLQMQQQLKPRRQKLLRQMQLQPKQLLQICCRTIQKKRTGLILPWVKEKTSTSF